MINPVAFQIFGYPIRWYGVIIAVGLLLAILLAMRHAKREGHDPDFVLDLALIVVPLAVIGARAYYVIFQWSMYAPPFTPEHPFWKMFAIWEGGLAIYGGVIGGFLGILVYWAFVSKKKMRLYSLLDIVAPSLILAQAIGRWGNFVNQEAYGRIIDSPAWQWFPAAVKIYGSNGMFTDTAGAFDWHMATFFYESMWNLLVFAFLFFYFRNIKTRKPGDVFWFYLLLYGIGRAFIEGLRTDSLMLGDTDVRVSQWLSIVLAVASAAVLLTPVVLSLVRKRKEALQNAKLDDSLRLISDDDMQNEEGEAAPEADPSTTDQVGEPTKEDKS